MAHWILTARQLLVSGLCGLGALCPWTGWSMAPANPPAFNEARPTGVPGATPIFTGDVIGFWTQELAQWAGANNIYTWLQKSNVLMKLVAFSAQSDAAQVEFYHTLFRIGTYGEMPADKAYVQNFLNTFLQPLSPAQLHKLLWAIVVEDAAKESLTGLARDQIEMIRTPMDTVSLALLAQRFLEKNDTATQEMGGPAKAQQTVFGMAKAPATGRGPEGAFGGMPERSKPDEGKGEEDASAGPPAHEGGGAVEAGSGAKNILDKGGTAARQKKSITLEGFIECAELSMGGKKGASAIVGGGVNPDPSPESRAPGTTPDGGGGTWGSGKKGEPTKAEDPGKETIGFGGDKDCFGLDPSQIPGYGTGKSPYDWKIVAERPRYTYDGGSGGVNGKYVTIIEKKFYELKTLAGDSKDKVIWKEKTTTVIEKDAKGKVISTDASTEKSKVNDMHTTPEANAKDFKETKEKLNQGGKLGNKVTEAQAPKDDGSKFDPMGDNTAFCGKSAAVMGAECFGSGTASPGFDPDACMESKLQQNKKIMDLDPNAPHPCAGGESYAMKLLPIFLLWDPIYFEGGGIMQKLQQFSLPTEQQLPGDAGATGQQGLIKSPIETMQKAGATSPARQDGAQPPGGGQ